MKKTVLSLLLIVSLALSSCALTSDDTATEATAPTEYLLTAIDHCVVEPDERAVMSDDDVAAFRLMMDAMLAHEDAVDIPYDTDLDFLLDLMRQSPYYFFLDSADAGDHRIRFTYACTGAEEAEMLSFIDSAFLELVNANAEEDDNELDTILKIYYAVTHRLTYDTSRDDNKQLGSPLFDYPGDEVYKALRDGKSLCFGFAYVLRFALLQRGVDCFCVYGESHAHNMGHEWNIIRYDGAFFNCDPSWDRADSGYSKLYHFGKTDAERLSDALEARTFSSYHFPSYGEVACTDTRFSIFRGVVRFSYVGDHRFYLEDHQGESGIFDTESFELS